MIPDSARFLAGPLPEPELTAHKVLAFLAEHPGLTHQEAQSGIMRLLNTRHKSDAWHMLHALIEDGYVRMETRFYTV